MKHDFFRFVNKVIMVQVPENQRPRYRWIVRVRPDGRVVARAPKIGVLVRDLNFKRDNDFGPPRLLPMGSTRWAPFE